jgi:hypothetical protein
MVMMMVTMIVHSYSGFREIYGQIIRGDNACDLNAEGLFLEFRILWVVVALKLCLLRCSRPSAVTFGKGIP